MEIPKFIDDIIKSLLCSKYEAHDWKPYQVYRDPGGYTGGWKKCSRCGKIIDEHLDPIEGRFDQTAPDHFTLKGF